MYLLNELGHAALIDIRVFTAFYFCALAIITSIAILSDNSKNENLPPGGEKSHAASNIFGLGLVLYTIGFLIWFGFAMKKVKDVLSEPIQPYRPARRGR